MKYGRWIVPLVVLAGIAIWLTRTSPSIPIKPTTDVLDPSPNSSLPTAPKLAAVPATPEELAKAKVLDEILVSKNDNDPRLDKEFLNLSEKTKELFREKYAALPSEKRNEKGTIVFLLGRNLKEPEDFRFLESVLSEAPCYSLENCQGSTAKSDNAAHEEMGTEVTLAYPQLVSLKAIEKYLGDKNATHAGLAVRVLETGKSSSVKAVSTLADRLLTQNYGG